MKTDMYINMGVSKVNYTIKNNKDIIIKFIVILN